MDRIRDLAARQRASLSSLTTSRSHRKTVDDDVKLTTSPDNTASEPIDTTTTLSSAFDPQFIQPALSSPVIVQAEPTENQAKSTSNTEVCKTKKKKKKSSRRTKKNKAGGRRAFIERLEADQKLFEMAEAVVNQNKTSSGTGRELSLHMSEVARDILEANKYIERKEQEISEINNRLEVMEENFNESKKQLEMAQLLASQVIESGFREQCKGETEAQLHDKIKAIIEDLKTSDVGTWSKQKTHAFLKNLLVIYSANANVVHSRCIGRIIMSLAKRFTSYSNYDEEYGAILFHLANGPDYKKYLLRSRDEDHRVAASYPPNHVYKNLHGVRKSKTGKESSADIDKSVITMISVFEHGIRHEKIMGGSLAGFFNPIPHIKVMSFIMRPCAEAECVVPGCHCEALERGELSKWALKLRETLSYKRFRPPGSVRPSFTETIDEISTAAQNFGIEVTLACVNEDSLPVIRFLYGKEDHPTKYTAVIRKLQASVERYGFRFGPCKSHGKVGYHIIPAEMVNGKISMDMQQKYMQKRMEILNIIRDEVKTFMDEAWGPCASEADKQRKDQITDMMNWYSSDYYLKYGSQFLEDCGTTFETCTPEQITMLKRTCVMCAKEAILADHSKLEHVIQDLEVHKLGGFKDSKAT